MSGRRRPISSPMVPAPSIMSRLSPSSTNSRRLRSAKASASALASSMSSPAMWIVAPNASIILRLTGFGFSGRKMWAGIPRARAAQRRLRQPGPDELLGGLNPLSIRESRVSHHAVKLTEERPTHSIWGSFARRWSNKDCPTPTLSSGTQQACHPRWIEKLGNRLVVVTGVSSVPKTSPRAVPSGPGAALIAFPDCRSRSVLVQIEQIPAVVLEDRIGAPVRVPRRFTDEGHSLRPQLLVVTPTVVGDEGNHRPPHLPVGLLKVLRRLVPKVKRELDPARLFGLHNGDPPLVRAVGSIGVYLQTELLGVETASLLLVVDEDARQADAHCPVLLCVSLHQTGTRHP